MLYNHDDVSLAVLLCGIAMVSSIGDCGSTIMLVLTEMESAVELASNTLAFEVAHECVRSYIRNQSIFVVPTLEIISKAVRYSSSTRAEGAAAVARTPTEIFVVATKVLIKEQFCVEPNSIQ